MRTLRGYLAILIVVGTIYGGYKLLPIYMTAYEFEDAIKEEAKLSAYSSRTEQDIRNEVMKKAKELEIPINPDELIVHRQGADVEIDATYHMRVDFPSMPVDLTFHPATRGRRII